MDKILKIMFSKKTSSKKLPEALRLATKLGGISEGEYIRIKLSVKEVFNLWEWVNALLNVIDKWSGFEIYYKDSLCKVNKEYRRLFYALQDVRSCYRSMQDDPADYEKCNPGWGCDHIQFISLGLKSLGYTDWYRYGHLAEPDTWVIDKNRILNEVQREIERKHLTVCPAFPNSRIQRVIDRLPDSFIIDEFWKIEPKMEMIDGVLTKVVNSISYNSEFEKDWFSMENLLSEINRETHLVKTYADECPYKKESPQWYDWMIDKNLNKQ